MDHAQLVDLIRDGVPADGKRWAELGAGTGNFTAALVDLLGPGALIVAVDRDRGALRTLDERFAGYSEVVIEPVVADFTQNLDRRGLDGILMANSLHFVQEKAPVLAAVYGMLRPGGTLLLVEYDTDRGNPWVPYPFSFRTWERLATAAGFTGTHLVGMYAAASSVPLS